MSWPPADRYALRLHAAGAADVPVRDGTQIGRGSDCDLFLDGASVSRHHAHVRLHREGPFLEDAGSRNGTLLNGKPVVGPTPLQHQDRIGIGDYIVSFIDYDEESKVGGVLAPPPRPSFAEREPASTQQSVHVVDLVLDGCAAALGDDDAEEAARTMEYALVQLGHILRSPAGIGHRAVDRAAELLIGLAAATMDPRWMHAFVALHLEALRVPGPAVADAAQNVCASVFPSLRKTVIEMADTLQTLPLSEAERARLPAFRAVFGK